MNFTENGKLFKRAKDMIMSRIKDWLIIILLFLVIGGGTTLYVMVGKWKKEKAEHARWEGNYEAFQTVNEKTIREKVLTKKELSQDKEIIETLKRERIKTKEARTIYKIHYRDTGSTRVSVVYTVDTANVADRWNYPIWSYYEEPCYKATWTYYPDKDTSSHTWDIEQNIQATLFERRENAFQIFGRTLFRYGKKKSYLTITDHCSDKQIINHQLITIKKE